MIGTTIGIVIVYALWLGYGILAGTYAALQSGVMYAHIVMAVFAAVYVAYLIFVLVRKFHGGMAVGLIKSAIAFAIMLALLFLGIFLTGGIYKIIAIVMFAVYAAFFAVMLLQPFISGFREQGSGKEKSADPKQE